jgi:hypothetical protein
MDKHSSLLYRKHNDEEKTFYTNDVRTFDDCDGRDCQYGLIKSQQMMEVMSAWGPLIYAGCFAATLSSAIGSLEGAPRVFQVSMLFNFFSFVSDDKAK